MLRIDRASGAPLGLLAMLILLLSLALGMPAATASVTPRAVTTPPAVTPGADTLGLGSDHVRRKPGRHTWQTFDRQVAVTTGPERDVDLSIDTRLYVPDNASR